MADTRITNGLLTFVFVATIVFGAVSAMPVDEKLTINILHTNDMHARFEQTSADSTNCSLKDVASNKCYGGFARIATLIRKGRNSSTPTIFLNAGDTYQGSVWFTVHKWKIVSRFLEILKPDAISLGNHEFDDGVKGLIPFVKNASYPIVTANLDLTNEPELRKAQALMNSTILQVNGRKIGVIGYLTPETKIVSDAPNVEFLDEIPVIREEAKKLKKQGVDILIALGHSGFNMDKQIAAEVEDIDLVIGGHTNTFLYTGTPPLANPKKEDLYPVVVRQKSGRKVYVVQAYAYTLYMGNLTVTFDKGGEIEEISGNPILVDNSVEQAPDVLGELEKWRPAVLNQSKQRVGYTRVTLVGSDKICRFEECNLGNLITDAMVDYAVNVFSGKQGWTSAPIAAINGGSIRSSVSKDNKNKIIMGDVMTSLPFNNEMVIVEMNKTVIYEMLEWSIHDRERGLKTSHGGAFLQMSGMRVTYDMSKPANSRVASVKVRCRICDVPVYEEVQSNRTYSLLLNSYIVAGGDGYTMLKSLKANTLDVAIQLVVTKYINKTSPVYPGVTGRIVFLNDYEYQSTTFRDNIDPDQTQEPDGTSGSIRSGATGYSMALILISVPFFANKFQLTS